MLKLNVKIDIEPALKKLADIPVQVREKACVRAINKMADQVKVQAAREIRDAGYNLKVAKIKSSISISRASASTLVARVRASGRPIGLINYGARQTKAGVTVQVKSGRKLIRHAFIATMPTGHRGVYVRKEGLQPGKRGKAILNRHIGEEKFGPSIPSAFMNQVVQDALLAAVNDKFPDIFRRELNYLSLK